MNNADLPADHAEYTELKNDYKQVKKRIKSMKNDPNANQEDRDHNVMVKKQMRQIIKISEKSNKEWKAMYKAEHKKHWLRQSSLILLTIYLSIEWLN